MRLFIAIELPEAVKSLLDGLQRNVPSVRWLPPGQIHLTLLFLGEVMEDKLEQISEALSEITVEPFTIQITKTGCFPHARDPRVLWVGLARQPGLEQLHILVRRVVSSCGILLEKRPFRPHITVARVKQPDSCDISSYLNQAICEGISPINVRQFILFQSILTQQGAIHKPIQAFPRPLN